MQAEALAGPARAGRWRRRAPWVVRVMRSMRAAAGLCAVLPAVAMTVQVQGDTVFAGGPVVDDLRVFEQAFAQPGVKRVAFVNSPGGDVWTALRVGRLIAERGLDTVTAGSCISACAIMFVGGRERRFADNFAPNLTYLGVHGAHNLQSKQVDPVLQPQLFAWFKQRLGDRFDSALMNQALYQMDDHLAMLRVYDIGREPRRITHHCRSGQTARRDCTEFAQADARSLGFVTQGELVRLELPAAFLPPLLVFGQAPGAPLPDGDAWLGDVAQRGCRSEACRQQVLGFRTRREAWAIALGTTAIGAAFVDGRDSPGLAAVHALYRCNHGAGGPRLCELEAAAGHATRDIYPRAEAAHSAALAALAAPADRFYANEEFGGGLTSEGGGYRTQRLNDITPASLAGISTVATGEVAHALRGAARPVLIDVGNQGETIPGAASLWFGGSANDDARSDEAIDARFRALLALLAPDKAAPLVFFCQSRSCWLSVNAARRAQRAGWLQVQWYRGGVEAWKAAGLPLVPALVRAVAN